MSAPRIPIYFVGEKVFVIAKGRVIETTVVAIGHDDKEPIYFYDGQKTKPAAWESDVFSTLLSAWKTAESRMQEFK